MDKVVTLQQTMSLAKSLEKSSASADCRQLGSIFFQHSLNHYTPLSKSECRPILGSVVPPPELWPSTVRVASLERWKRGKGHTICAVSTVAFSSPKRFSVDLLWGGKLDQNRYGQCLLAAQSTLRTAWASLHVGTMFYVYRWILKSSRASWGIELYMTYIWHCFKMSEVCSELHKNFHIEKWIELTFKKNTRCKPSKASQSSNDTQVSRRISSACHKLMPFHAGFRPQRQKISIAVSELDVELQIKGSFDPDYIVTLTSQWISDSSWKTGRWVVAWWVHFQRNHSIWSKGSSFGKLGKQAKVLPRWYWQFSHQVMLLPIWWESTIVAGRHFGDEIFGEGNLLVVLVS